MEIKSCLGVRHRNGLIRLYRRIRRDVSSDPATLRSISTYRVFRDLHFIRSFLGRLQQTDSLRLLLTSSSPDSGHPTFLFLAALSGQAAFIQEVLTWYRQQLPRFHRKRLLYAACHSGSLAAVEDLLTAGARADCRTAHQPNHVRDGRWEYGCSCTTLMHAAFSGSAEVLQLVLHQLHQQRVDAAEHVAVRDDVGRTALYWWARGRRGAAALNILLDAGVDINARSKTGQTALYWSAGESDEAAVHALLKARAAVNLRVDDSQVELSRIRDGQPWFRMKANPAASDELGMTALHYSARRGDAPIVRLLVEADVHLRASTPPWYRDVPRRTQYTNKTPLEVAVLYERTAVADYLTDKHHLTPPP